MMVPSSRYHRLSSMLCTAFSSVSSLLPKEKRSGPTGYCAKNLLFVQKTDPNNCNINHTFHTKTDDRSFIALSLSLSLPLYLLT